MRKSRLKNFNVEVTFANLAVESFNVTAQNEKSAKKKASLEGAKKHSDTNIVDVEIVCGDSVSPVPSTLVPSIVGETQEVVDGCAGCGKSNLMCMCSKDEEC